MGEVSLVRREMKALPKWKLAKLASQIRPAPLWLEKRICESLSEPPEEITDEEFKKEMKEIANGR